MTYMNTELQRIRNLISKQTHMLSALKRKHSIVRKALVLVHNHKKLLYLALPPI